MRTILILPILLLAVQAGCGVGPRPSAGPTVPISATREPGSPTAVALLATATSAGAAITAPAAASQVFTPSPKVAAAGTTTAPAATPTSASAAAPTRVVPPAGQINLPAGFGISVFASGLSAPRNIAIGPDGQLYVVERGAGRVIRLADAAQTGVADGVQVVADGLDAPSSLAFFKDGSLYVSTPSQVLRLSQPDANGVFQKRDLVIDGLPGRQDHFTRTLVFSPDWSSLFIQIGSSCDACVEDDSRRATIMRFNADGSGGAIYARGLRNAVGVTIRPGTGELWATDNGSDKLGDNQPADTIVVVHQGDDYGWPRCEAGVVNPQFGGADACNGLAQPLVKIQAHSAALGLTFYDGTRFPSDYRGDLFVALHGSIYRSSPTGYKVVRIHFVNGQPGAAQDFATGWLLSNGRAWGRPVDVVTAPDGSLFVSDDSGGIIYLIFYGGS